MGGDSKYLGLWYVAPYAIGLILFTAFVGMLLAAPGMVPLSTLFFGLIGIGLAAAAGAALNHGVDQRIDTGRGAPMVRAGLEGDEDLCAAGLFTGCVEGMNLGMRLSGPRMPALSD